MKKSMKITLCLLLCSLGNLSHQMHAEGFAEGPVESTRNPMHEGSEGRPMATEVTDAQIATEALNELPKENEVVKKTSLFSKPLEFVKNSWRTAFGKKSTATTESADDAAPEGPVTNESTQGDKSVADEPATEQVPKTKPTDFSSESNPVSEDQDYGWKVAEKLEDIKQQPIRANLPLHEFESLVNGFKDFKKEDQIEILNKINGKINSNEIVTLYQGDDLDTHLALTKKERQDAIIKSLNDQGITATIEDGNLVLGS